MTARNRPVPAVSGPGLVQGLCPVLGLVLVLVLGLAACDEGPTGSAPPPSAPTAAAPPAEPSSSMSRSLGEQPNSAVGGAKRAAARTAKSIEDRQNELSREIDKQLEDQ